ncbi:hypothetical protein SAMN05421863_11138, partial [Nitrosomonas communis]
MLCGVCLHWVAPASAVEFSLNGDMRTS